MDKHDEHSQKGGLFLGVIVGVAATLLVTTKRGRKLLHALSDEGIDKLGDWESILKDVADAIEDDDLIEGDDYVDNGEREHPRYIPEEEVVRRVPDVPPMQHNSVPAEPPQQSHHPQHQSVPPEVPHGVTHHEVHHPQQVPQVVPTPAPEVWSQSQPPQVHGEPVTHSSHEQQSYVAEEPAQPQASVSRPRTVSRRFFRGIPRRG